MNQKHKPRNEYQQTLMQMLSCRPVAYWPALARRVGGVKAAVMLSQLLYWHGDPEVQKREGCWFYKSVEDLETETGLTKLEQQTARNILQRWGIIECKLKSMPRTWWYRVDMDRLGDVLIGSVSHPMGKPSNGKAIQWQRHPMAKPPNIGRESHPILGRKPIQYWMGNRPILIRNQRLHQRLPIRLHQRLLLLPHGLVRH